MKITLTGSAYATDAESGEPIDDPKRLRELDGLAFSKSSCGEYVDVEFLDLGLSGGTIRCAYSDANELTVTTEYLAPERLTAEQLQRLAEDTAGQLSDGIGEEGLRFETRTGAVDVWSEGNESDMRIDQVDDGLRVAAPSLASRAARNGDLDALRSALASGENIEIRIQGMTPLHWAITYGQVDACALLLERGADPNASDREGESPLMLCALVNSISDDVSACVARLLLEKGANKDVTNSDGDSPRSVAADRGKTLLFGLL